MYKWLYFRYMACDSGDSGSGRLYLAALGGSVSGRVGVLIGMRI